LHNANFSLMLGPAYCPGTVGVVPDKVPDENVPEPGAGENGKEGRNEVGMEEKEKTAKISRRFFKEWILVWFLGFGILLVFLDLERCFSVILDRSKVRCRNGFGPSKSPPFL
jgi:hypothetical protein